MTASPDLTPRERALSDAEVNERLALAMGWQLYETEAYEPVTFRTGRELIDDGWHWEGSPYEHAHEWQPCRSDRQMRLVRDEMARRDLKRDFMLKLTCEADILLQHGYYRCDIAWEEVFDAFNAPCALQARAALAVLEAAMEGGV